MIYLVVGVIVLLCIAAMIGQYDRYFGAPNELRRRRKNRG